MRLVLLGAPRPIDRNRWKDDAAEGAEALGWSVVHVEARDIPADEVVRLCWGADMLLWARTHGSRPSGDVLGCLRRVEDAGTVTVGLHLDLYWGIARREPDIGADPFWSCQYVFTADGGQRDWAGRGVNHFWCPPPVGERWLGRGMADVRWLANAVFVGRWVPNVHGAHRRDLIVWAMRRWTTGFIHVDGRRVRAWGSELSNVYASAQVAIGDSAPADRYWSDRVTATLARGGLLAHPEVEGMYGQGFVDGETLVTFPRGDFALLGDKLAAVTDADRARITDNAMTLIAERHTWARRLEEIAAVVSGAGHHRVRRQPDEVAELHRPAQPSRAG